MPEAGPPVELNGGTSSDPHIVLARAKFLFNGKNNDELSFVKNDVIMITQQLEGGWWEGTLNGQTGWFPSNYVTVITEKEKLNRSRSVPNTDVIDPSVAHQPTISDFVTPSSRNEFRTMVIQDFLMHESNYLVSLKKTVDDYLVPIKTAKIMSDDDFHTLSGNIEQILAFQTDVMNKLQVTLSEDIHKQRIGGVLLAAAPALQAMMMGYCRNHPRAVEVLNEKHADLEVLVKTLNGDMKTLIMGLSEPFRHLDKYPTVLHELERSLPESHVDRGDVQRSCAVHKAMRYACESVRKQKEMQLEFLAAGQVDAWAPFAERGKIKNLGLVDVEKQGEEPETRFLVLFANVILILEVTSETNAYKLSEKWVVTGQTIKRVDGRHAIAFGKDPPIVFAVSSQFEVDQWMDAFSDCNGAIVEEGTTIIQPAFPISYDVQDLVHPGKQKRLQSCVSPPRQPLLQEMPSAERARVSKKASFGHGDLKFNHDLEMIVPEADEPDANVIRSRNAYSGTCLRPCPPLRPNMAVDYSKKPVRMRRGPDMESNEDAVLLRIIEGYWQGGKSAPPAYDSQPPQLIVAEDEKILVEELVGGEVVFQEKSLVDTVYALKDQVNQLQQKMDQLVTTLDREQKARRRLEDMWRRGSGQLNMSLTPVPSTPKQDSGPL